MMFCLLDINTGWSCDKLHRAQVLFDRIVKEPALILK